jgi:hypothetical protein
MITTPIIYDKAHGEVLSRWRIEWEIDPCCISADGQMEMEFHSEDDFDEHLKIMRECEAEGLCRNIRTYSRTITIGDWEES